MPNWCENNLQVIGPKDLLLKFAKDWEGMSLNTLIPDPLDNDKRLEQMIRSPIARGEVNSFLKQLKKESPYEAALKYDWCCALWGTKWDIDKEESVQDEINVVKDFSKGTVFSGYSCRNYWFQTAWSPATLPFHQASMDYPGLTFVLEYYEPGCEFAGIHVSSYGETYHKCARLKDFQFSIDLMLDVFGEEEYENLEAKYTKEFVHGVIESVYEVGLYNYSLLGRVGDWSRSDKINGFIEVMAKVAVEENQENAQQEVGGLQ